MSRKVDSKSRYILGDYWIICQITGQKVMRSKARYNWKGQLVSLVAWEEKHPQIDLRGRKDDIAVEDARPRQPTVFESVENQFLRVTADGDQRVTDDGEERQTFSPY